MAALLLFLLGAVTVTGLADGPVGLNVNADLYSRYIWRGIDIASTPSVQPSLSVAGSGIEVGVWGAYTLSGGGSPTDEVDFWLSYSVGLGNGASIAPIVTDYYFPNAGIDFSNFNDYDAVVNDSIPDPGAHTVELGLSVTGPEAVPVTLSGYVNIHNDAGHNTYFEVSYPVAVDGTGLTFVCGATGGSTENPDYYGSDTFAVINVGVKASRPLVLSDTFSLPLIVGITLNPKAEVTNLLVGLSF